MNEQKRILVSIPAHNEEKNIARTVAEIRSVLPAAVIVVIDDCSSDMTAAQAAEAGAVVVPLDFNTGIAGARQAGYQFALREGFDIVVQMDADGQHDPRFIGSMLHPVAEGTADVCIGSRFVSPTRYQQTFLRDVGIRLISGCIRMLTGLRISDPTSGFRAVNKRVIAVYNRRYPYEYPEPEELVILHREGMRISEVPVEMRLRTAGKSFLTPLTAVYYMCSVVLSLMVMSLCTRRRSCTLCSSSRSSEA